MTEQQRDQQQPREAQPLEGGDERPTPQLTQSQVRRMTQPMIGMLITMAITVAVVVGFLMMNPEPDLEPYQRDEDVEAAAANTADVTDYEPLAPDVPASWSANYARWETRPEQGVPVWEVGYTTQDMQFIGFTQTDRANPTWINDESRQSAPSGSMTVGDTQFEVRHGEGDRDYYVLSAEQNDVDGTTVVVTSDAEDDELHEALRLIIDALGRQPGAADESSSAGGQGSPDDAQDRDADQARDADEDDQ